MRKIALFAMLAIVAAMLPMSTASSQLDGVGTVRVINASNEPLDICIEVDDGNFKKFSSFPGPSAQDFNVPKGSHDFAVSYPGSNDECQKAIDSGSFNIESNDNLSFVVQPNPTLGAVFVAENDTDQTEHDNARITLHNLIPGGALLSVCIDGEAVVTNIPGQNSGDGEFDAKDGEEQDVEFIVGGPFGGCGAPQTQINFPPGGNFVVVQTANAACLGNGACIDIVIVGEEPPSSEQQVDPFCQVIFGLQAAQDAVAALVVEIEVGDPDTYPDPDELEKAITALVELIDNGNELVPDAIADAWFTLTGPIAEIGLIAAVDYDLERLPQSDLADLVAGFDTPAADDEEAVAATEALTAWVTANCFGTVPVETEPNFTG